LWVLPLVGIIVADQREDHHRLYRRDKVYTPRSGLSAEVAVVFVDPVLAGWGEDVEVDAVGEGSGGVGETAGDDEDLAGVDSVGGAVVEVEAESAFSDEGDLLVVVRVAGNDTAFGEYDAGKHGLGSGDELAGEERVELFVFDIAPVVEGGGGHEWMPFF
jgi:hypothetical protein